MTEDNKALKRQRDEALLTIFRAALNVARKRTATLTSNDWITIVEIDALQSQIETLENEMADEAVTTNPHPTKEQAEAALNQMEATINIGAILHGRPREPEYAATIHCYMAALAAENKRLIEALTPSEATKSAYNGEFSFSYTGYDPDNELPHTAVHLLPWTTIKNVMAAILKRANEKGASK